MVDEKIDMRQIALLEKQRDLIIKSMAAIICATPTKTLVRKNGSFEDVTEYPCLSEYRDALDNINFLIAEFVMQIQGHKRIS